MRTLRRARILRVAALTVPAVMSLALVLVVAVVPFGFVVLPAWVALAAWALTPAGEGRVLQLRLRAHPAGPFERYTLAPVAQVLAEHGVPPVRHLLVADHRGWEAQAFGTGTVAVSQGMVQALANRQLSHLDAAVMIAHEIGIMRTGLIRRDPALLVLLFPWQIWLSIIVGLWNGVGVILRPSLRWASLLIAFAVQLWLGLTDPRHLLIAALLSLVFSSYALLQAWERTRPLVGDALIANTTLGPAYADFLLRHRTDLRSRDRAILIGQHCSTRATEHAPAYSSQP